MSVNAMRGFWKPDVREITMIVICTGLSVSRVQVSVTILLIVVMFVARTMYVHFGVAMIVSMVENRPMD